jgi:hypothetical protein
VTSPVLRVLGVLIVLGAVVVAILNLHRVANLGMTWLPPLMIIIAVVFITVGSKRPR